MKITEYRIKRIQHQPENVVTELINNTITQMNDEEPIRQGFQPYWELDQFSPLTDEIYLIFARWEP